ncbi:MAG TPA: GTPase [Xanthobacteraceae bacterium]|nr:GTPase [Xanthobacteraceae bacterium]
MIYGGTFRRYWRETLLFLAVALPWLSLLLLGSIWLWQHGYIWVWSLAAAALGLLAWPLSKSIQRRAKRDARIELADLAEPSRSWNAVERDAWSAVLEIADTAAPLTFTELAPILTRSLETIETVARRFHPESVTPTAQFSLPELLLLTERLSRDIRREALRHIPAVEAIRLSHLLWMHRQNERYGAIARKGWELGFGLWRIIRAAINPLQAIGQETSGMFVHNAARVLSYRLQAYATRLLVLEVGRAAIDLYAGRLTLSPNELQAARERDMAGEAPALAPARIVLMGQVNAGKSSLVNALAQEIRGAVGPLPTTSHAAEYLIDLEGRPALSVVDMPGLDERTELMADLIGQVERGDLIVWVASAIQPARGPDRKQLDAVRAWVNAQRTRRTPPILLALTHVDELSPASEWTPPYDINLAASAKARTIRAAMDATARALDLPSDAIVPVAMPPGRDPYNLDALWARIALELDEAKLVQLDRLRVGQRGLSLRVLANQLGRAGRLIIKGIVNP